MTPVVERAGRKGEEKQRECLGSDKGAHCVFHRERERCCARRDAALAERPLRSTRATDGRIARATVPLGHAVSRLATQRSAVSYRVPSRLVVFVEGTVCSRSSTVFTPAFANPPFYFSIRFHPRGVCVCINTLNKLNTITEIDYYTFRSRSHLSRLSWRCYCLLLQFALLLIVHPLLIRHRSIPSVICLLPVVWIRQWPVVVSVERTCDLCRRGTNSWSWTRDRGEPCAEGSFFGESNIFYFIT